MWVRPLLIELLSRARADMRAALAGADPALRRSAVRGLADTHAGGCHELHGHLAWLAKQLFAATAEDEFLDAQGLEWVGGRLPASLAMGGLSISGTNGAVVPAGTIWRRTDGVEYTVDADAAIAVGAATAAITCSTYGATGNADEGATLTIASPIAGIQSSASIAAGGLSGGSDAEGDESYRARILRRKRTPPELGNRADYIRWALEVPGTTRAWISSELGPGSVVVRFVRDGDPSIYPNTAAVAAMTAYLISQAPYPASITAAAPTPLVVDFDLVVTPSNTAVHDAVEAALVDLIYRAGVPGGILLVSDIGEAIGAAVGVMDWHIVAPADDVVFATHEIGEMGAITWA